MPKRTDLNHILVIGSGPIIIGQACEFDYSGTQACRVLRAEGLQVSLVNSNPATIMTDPEFADNTYVEPITPAFVERVIAQQAERGNKIDALLATLGGQTALNTAVALYENGVLDRYGVEMIGADFEAIQRGEDRQRFKDIVAKVGGESAKSRVCFTMDEVRETVQELGLPVVVRPSFTMGGLGSGMAYSAEDVDRMAGDGLAASPSANVLIEESIYGWKEFELELMRDGHDNVVVVCSIENFDPMGVHTGDSVTVAPAMTLTDREYQRMRDLGIAVLREVGVDTGGCNIQFAINPADGRLIVIEMNPRVSRSSALASKATGFPIAKIAAKLAIGYTLDEILNDITKETPACFEPTLDYVVVKAPRFAFEKFPGADPTLTTTMKSVGEAMSLGRNFIEALGKVMRSLETGRAGFWTGPDPEVSAQEVLERLNTPTDGRLYDIELALRLGASVRGGGGGLRRRPVVRRADQRAGGAAHRTARRPGARRGAAEAQQAQRPVGPPDRRAAAGTGRRGRCPGIAPTPRHPPGVQDRRHLRGRVRGQDAIPLQQLRARPRRRDRGRAADRETQGAHSGLRTEPHRPGHRIRLQLRARRDDAVGRRVRDSDGQLQPRDGVDGLRHRRPVVLRTADLRGRPRGVLRRIGLRCRRSRRCRRHRAARRADAARLGRALGEGGRADRRDQPEGHRPRRGPRRVR